MRYSRKTMLAIATATLSSASLFQHDARATTFTWNGANVTWATAGNWQTGAPTSATTTDLLFINQGVTGTSATPLNQNIGSNFVFNSLTFGSGASSFFIGGSNFGVTATMTINENAANNQSIANAFTNSGGNSTQNLMLAGTGTGIVTMSGAITNGNGQRMIAITKSGANSTYVLSNTGNTFGGGVTINSGTLISQAAAAFGSSDPTLGGGTLGLEADTGTNFGYNVTVTANSAVSSDRITNGAGVTQTLGTLSIGSLTLNVIAGSHDTSGVGSTVFGATTLTANGAIFDVASNAALTLGAMSGNFGWAKQGAGLMLLNTASSRSSGSVTLTAGELDLGSASALGTTGVPLQLNGGDLDLAISTTVNAYNTTVGGDMTIESDRAASGAGVTHTLGTLAIGNNNLSIVAGGSVTSGVASVVFGATTISANNATFTVGTGAALTTGAVSGNNAFAKQGAGTMILATASSRTSGAVTLGNGSLILGNANALGTTGVGLNLNGGNLDLAVSTTINAYNTTVGGNTTILSDRAAAGAGITHTLGTLGIGGNKLSILAGANSTSGTAGVAFGNTTITATGAEFSVGSTASLSLASISDNGSATTWTKSGAGPMTITGATSSMVNGTIIDITGGTLAVNNATGIGTMADVVLSTGATYNLGAAETIGALDSAASNTGSVVLNANNLTIGNTNNLNGSFAGIVSGTGALIKNGTGIETLAGADSYSGGSTLNTGTVVAANASAMGTGSVVLAGGALNLGLDSATNFASNVTVTANSTVSSDRATNGAGVSHTLGTLNIGANTLNVLAGGHVTSGSAGTTFGATTLGANGAVFNVGSNAVLTLGAMSGNFSWAKQGGGLMSLPASSSRTSGQVTLTAGEILLGSTSALGTAAVPLQLNGGSLDLATSSSVNAYNVTLGGNTTILSDRATSGAALTHTLGTLGIGGNKLTVLAGSNVTSGTAGVAFGNTTMSASGAEFSVDSAASLALASLSDNGTSKNWTKSGGGVMTITGATGSMVDGSAVNITGGTLAVNNATGLGVLADVILSTGATYNVGASQTIGALDSAASNTGSVVLNANTLTIGNSNNLNGSFAGVISGNGAVTKSGGGIQIISGANTYIGLTTINSGTLLYAASDAISTGGVTVNGSGATLDLGANHTDSVGQVTLTNGSIRGSGTSALTSTVGFDVRSGLVTIPLKGAAIALTKSTGGTVTSTGDNTYTGTTSITQGTYILNGHHTGAGDYTVSSGATLGGSGSITFASGANLVINGTISPGNSPGTFTAITSGAGVTRLAPAGQYTWQIQDETQSAGTGWDFLSLQNLDVTALATAGSQFIIDIQSLQSSGAAGAMAEGAGQAWDPTLVNVHFPIMSFTGGLDPSLLSHFQLDTSGFANTNSGGFSLAIVDDHLDVVYHAAVPEPTALSMLALGVPALLRRRRRSR